jgi:hypothetical protein
LFKAKSAKKRKQTDDKSSQVFKKLKTDVSESPATCQAELADIGGLIFADELETTTETLCTLAKNPELISLKALKPFRTAVHDYWRAANEASSTGAFLRSQSYLINPDAFARRLANIQNILGFGRPAARRCPGPAFRNGDTRPSP